MSETVHEAVVVGGGAVGVATALALQGRGVSVTLLEAEGELCAHQTGNNSGVIHSGLYYAPGSLKARNCVAGREALYRFCQTHGVVHERCGKLVVATETAQLERLEALRSRGEQNGLEGLRILSAAEARQIEPQVQCVAALHVPQTGIVDYRGAVAAMAARLSEGGAQLRLGTRLLGARHEGSRLRLETSRGRLYAKRLICCAGLYSDRLARACGMQPELRIVPFRGEYYRLLPQAEGLLRHLIYPLPDPRYPFLGVHFTRMARGGAELGPNAVLATAREGYSRWRVNPRDLVEILSYPGFWRMAARHGRMGAAELLRSLSRRLFVREAQRMVPALRASDVLRGGAGVRAQALAPDGRLLDDFFILCGEGMLHVLNAPSPAATACLSIAEHLVELLDA
ncbi:MAG: L-2-hydroxyglutarate oxidase [Myxococcota bacterium]|jgi:L-2-hydroxyglutarate oxidase|nr:L-2-hydroxyglutarate oxidase [Myxococcota bacterium]